MTWLDLARVSDVERDILRWLHAWGAQRISIRDLADAIGRCPRAVVHALAQLERDGYLTRDGEERKVSTLTLKSDAECEKIACRAPDAGREYNPVSDKTAAWRDRMVYAYRVGSGTAAWREAGGAIVRGDGPDGLSDDARVAWEAAQ